MKKRLLLLCGVWLAAGSLLAGVPDGREMLPEQARTLLATYFAELRIVGVSPPDQMDRGYRVVLSDGTTARFDARGEWVDIERPRGALPDSLVPRPIRRIVAERYPGAAVAVLLRVGRGYEIWLDEGHGMRFDRKFRLVAEEE